MDSELLQFRQLRAVIRDGIDRQLHTGVQVYVSVGGETILNAAVGESSPGVSMTSSTMMLWRSAGKPLTAAAILQRAQQSRLSIDAELCHFLPEAKSSVTGSVTIRQILTHTTGLPLTETEWPDLSWNDILLRILAIDHRDTVCAYQPQCTWFLLGEILQRGDDQDRDFRSIIADDVLAPFGMTKTHCGIQAVQNTENTEHHPTLYIRERGQLRPSEYSGGKWLIQPSPGGNWRGPVGDLGRFYEILLSKGTAPDGTTVLDRRIVADMTTRQRQGRFDHTFQHTVDMGLGLIVDSNIHGAETVPYGFGRHCSPRSFGHGGAQCAMGFCDPKHQLVVAWAANGFCGEGQHQRRNRAINEAVYVDLGLV